MSLSTRQKKNCLRLAIAGVYLLGMVVLYGSDRDVIWWFWMWPLAIAIFIYNLILWFSRCPACRQEFSLKPIEQGALFTTYVCRNCGERRERINTGGTPGGGGP